MKIRKGRRGQRPDQRQQPQEQQGGGCYDDLVSNEIIPIVPSLICF